MSHLNDSNSSKYNFTVLANLDSSLEKKQTQNIQNKKTQNKKIQDDTSNSVKVQSKNISCQLAPARYTLHRFGVEVTHFGIGDGLGWDLTSVYCDDGLNVQSMILYPGDILELAQPEICLVPRKVDDFVESRRQFFKGKLLVCIANDHHLSVLYGIEKRTIQLARYYGDKLLSEPDGKILDECRWTVLGAVENIIRPYPDSKNNFTQPNISGKHWQVSLTIPSNLLETSRNTDPSDITIAFNHTNITPSQVLMIETIGELLEDQFQNHAEMDNINALTSFVSKYIPQIQITLQSHHKPESKSNHPLSTPIRISSNVADTILGTRLKPIFLYEGPKYKNTMLSHYQRNRNRRRLECSMEIAGTYMKMIDQADTLSYRPFSFNEDQIHRLIEERILKDRMLRDRTLKDRALKECSSEVTSTQNTKYHVQENYIQENYIRKDRLSIMRQSQKISK